MPSSHPCWELTACDEAARGALAAALGIEPAVARLLCQRGLGDPELARALSQPVARAPARSDAARRHARWPSIGSWRRSRARSASPIHGDYDVDGITSTVILRRALELLGADVVHFIPERLRDGYGLQPAAIDRLHADGVALIDLGRLRHPRRRRGPARARARRRPDHHRPPRAGRRAAAGAGRDQSRSATTAAIPTSTWPASAWR